MYELSIDIFTFTMTHSQGRGQGLAYPECKCLGRVQDKVTVLFLSNMKSCMSCQLAYLHLTLTNTKGQGQGHAHFDDDYLANDEI